MKNKILEQENLIKENKREISNLSQKIEKISNNTTNDLKNKEEKLNKIEEKLSALKVEKEEQINKLNNKISVQRVHILSTISDKLSKLNIVKSKKIYNIIVFGESGYRNNDFCEFILRDKSHSIYVCDSFPLRKFPFTRIGTNFEISDTIGFREPYIENDYNYLKKLKDYIDIKNSDYIILLLSFGERLNIISDFIKILIEIYTPEKLYSNCCIVFNDVENSRKPEYEELIHKMFQKIFKIKKNTIDLKFYYIDTKCNDDYNFDENYQDIIDTMLKEIKISIDYN